LHDESVGLSASDAGRSAAEQASLVPSWAGKIVAFKSTYSLNPVHCINHVKFEIFIAKFKGEFLKFKK